MKEIAPEGVTSRRWLMVKSVFSVGKQLDSGGGGGRGGGGVHCEKMNSESESARLVPGILGGRPGRKV